MAAVMEAVAAVIAGSWARRGGRSDGAGGGCRAGPPAFQQRRELVAAEGVEGVGLAQPLTPDRVGGIDRRQRLGDQAAKPARQPDVRLDAALPAVAGELVVVAAVAGQADALDHAGGE